MVTERVKPGDKIASRPSSNCSPRKAARARSLTDHDEVTRHALRPSLRCRQRTDLLALIMGCWGALSSPLDVFPEFVPSQWTSRRRLPGLAPQQVEELVTKQVENAVNGTPGLATMRSESIPGLSVVTITFADNIDVHVARQGISERLSELGSTLPAGVGTPKLSPLVSSTMDLLKSSVLLSDKVDAYELRDTADWIIKPRLLAVPGVAHVIVFGGSVRQIQIQPDVHKLAAFGLTMADVADAARTALPLRGAGFIDTPAQRILLQSPTPTPDIETREKCGHDHPERHSRAAGGGRAGPDRSGAALRRLAHHGQARRAAVVGQSVWSQHAHHHVGRREGAVTIWSRR